MSEILKEARQIILFVLLLCVLWLLTSGALRTSLATKSIIEDLGVWVLLNDALSRAYSEDQEDSFAGAKVGGLVDEVTVLLPAQSGTEVPQKKKLTVRPAWQPGSSIDIRLRRLPNPDAGVVFEVLSSDERIAGARHMVALLNGRIEVFSTPPHALNSVRDLYNAIYRDGYGGPNARESVLNILWSKGWKGKTYKDLASTDQTISGMIRELREQKYMISGVPVSPSLFSSAVSFLFLISAFNLLGPIIKLRQGDHEFSREVWVMAIDYHGKYEHALKVARAVAVLIAVSLPIWVTIDQYGVVQLLDRPVQLYWWALSWGGPLASAMIAIFAFSLFRAKSARSEVDHSHSPEPTVLELTG